jgi:metal-responsive CopG/Arc/MetJ family transcriptional regulator
MSKLQTPQKSKRDVIVSVRLPKELVSELKDIQQVNHFMDLSDEIRFVVRKYCLSFLNSQGSQSIQSPIELLAEQKRKEQLIQELTKIIDNLKGDKQNTLQNTNKDE